MRCPVKKMFDGGVPIEHGKGAITICLDEPLDELIKQNFTEITSDIKILNIAYTVAKKISFRTLFLSPKM